MVEDEERSLRWPWWRPVGGIYRQGISACPPKWEIHLVHNWPQRDFSLLCNDRDAAVRRKVVLLVLEVDMVDERAST
jgi:hypothetical protein